MIAFLMRTAQQGDTVRVHYTGTLEDGTVFDSSKDADPIEVTLGSGDVIAGFEEALMGMAAGDKKQQRIVAEDAYGPYRDELVFTLPRATVPEDMEIEVGDFLSVGFPDGGTAPAQVAALDEENVTLDANHPLAGRTLLFDLELVSIG